MQVGGQQKPRTEGLRVTVGSGGCGQGSQGGYGADSIPKIILTALEGRQGMVRNRVQQ